jgi:hypothetical protein
LFGIKYLKHHSNLKLIRNNEIGAEGAAKFGLEISKLVNLSSLNLNFW